MGGLSGAPREAGQGMGSVEQYADWVARYVEAQADQAGSPLQSVVLNGHSMGGAITLALALRRPAWLRAIVLTGTGARLRVLPRLMELLRDQGLADVLVVIGGIIPDLDVPRLKALGIKGVFVPGTPMQQIIDFINANARVAPPV